MSTGGLTFGATKDILGQVVENGVCGDDPRVIIRTNEATKAILDVLIPVGGMITADILATGANGDELFLPKEFENAIEVDVLGATVHGESDVTQGWYEIVNRFAYVNPDAQHDNPLEDLFLQPDPNDASTLRRKYRYKGLGPNATVRVTGAKRYIPITQDNDYLIVQNILALKDMIQAIEKGEDGNDADGAAKCHERSIQRLKDEATKHQLDPNNSLKRKAQYDDDLIHLPTNSFGWMRARLAHILPGGLSMGKGELGRMLEQAEMHLLDAGQFVGTIREFNAEVTQGNLLTPAEVDCILACSLNGQPLTIKNMYFKYMQQGHRWWGDCHSLVPELQDEGEQIYPDTGERRRQYHLNVETNGETMQFRFVAALRWVRKMGSEQMAIRNFEAIRLMCMSFLDPQNNSPEAAVAECERELTRYLSGQLMVAPINWGMDWNRRYPCRYGLA